VTTAHRIAILPRELSSEVATSAVATGGWSVAIVLIALDIPVLIDVMIDRGIADRLAIPLIALVTMLGLVISLGRSRTPVRRAIYIGGAAVTSIVFVVTVLRADPALNSETTFLLNRPAVAVILLSPTIMRPMFGFLWSTIGLGISIVITVVASVIAGAPFTPGWAPFTSWAIYSVAFAVLTLVRRSQATTVPDLEKLEGETTRLALESQFEQRAAALIHDTVLGDLTTVMNSTGTLDSRARERLAADVSTLKNPSWLRDPHHELTVDERDATVRNAAIALASEMQWRGLTVDLTGRNDSVVRLSPEAIDAVLAALRASLENVLAHSGTTSAELVAGGSEKELTYMVIDHGVGFEPAAVAKDRLGLRNSVFARVEEHGGFVRVWSQPGNGTSVSISMPQSVEEVSDDR
jgi:signal transduction histidine kinase